MINSLAASALGLPGESDQARHYANRGLEAADKGDLVNAEANLRRAVELSPHDANYVAELAGILGRAGKLEEAATYFEQAVEIEPANLTLRRDLAATEWQLGKLREAKANLNHILKVTPGDKQATLLLGMVEENLENYAQAARLLQSVPSLVRERPESIAALARSCYRTGQRTEAQKALLGLLDHPAWLNGIFVGGQVAARAGDYETALRLFRSIQTTFPDRGALGYGVADAAFHARRYAECENRLVDLTNAGYQTGETYNLLGWCYYKQGKFEQSTRALDLAIDLAPRSESNYLDLGQMLIEHHFYPVALAVADKAIERIPGSYPLTMLKGRVEAKQGRYTDAIRSYAKAVELNPESPEANFNLAKVQSLAGMTKEAEAAFELGIRKFPHDALTYLEYALMLFRLAESGNAALETRAISLLKTAIAQDPSLAEPHYQLGNLWLRKVKIAEALEELKAAAELDANDPRIHYALSRLYRRLGQRETASKEFELYRTLKSDEDEAAAAAFPGAPQN